MGQCEKWSRDKKFRTNVEFCMNIIYRSCSLGMVILSFRHYKDWRLIYKCLRILIKDGVVERVRMNSKYKYHWVGPAVSQSMLDYMVDTIRADKKKDNDNYKEIRKAKEELI